MTHDQQGEAAVQSLISLASELKPWTESFKAQVGLVLAGFAEKSAPPDIDPLDLLLTAYLRVFESRHGDRACKALQACMGLARQGAPVGKCDD